MSKQHDDMVREYPFASRAKVSIKNYIASNKHSLKVNFIIMKPLITRTWEMVTNLTFSVPSIEINDVEKLFTILQETNISKLNFFVHLIHLHSSGGFWYDLFHKDQYLIDNFFKQNSDAFKQLVNNEKITDFVYTKWEYLAPDVTLTDLEKDFLKKVLPQEVENILCHKRVKAVVMQEPPEEIEYYTDLVTYFIKKISTQSRQQQENFLKNGDEFVTHNNLITFSGYNKDNLQEKKLVKEIRKQNPAIGDTQAKNFVKLITDANILSNNADRTKCSPQQQEAAETTAAYDTPQRHDFMNLLGAIEIAEEASN
ncbi:hypothetical protein [Candidatus Tisiphia endosymbiont of Beris chalybata]|uniref:hypothetical protein n=1 Tax=Candidatus Tisiphia endosymbiont of Beris chalybata TaxID=3066262 RepID=UPI00312C957A